MTEKELMRRFTAILFAAVWLGCVYGLIVSIHSTRQFLDVAHKASGVVVALNAGGSHPQIEFTNTNGERISYPQGGLIFNYMVGDKVTVLYLENSSAQQATIDQFGAIWESPIYFTFMVILIPLIEFINTAIRRFNRRKKSEQWKITE